MSNEGVIDSSYGIQHGNVSVRFPGAVPRVYQAIAAVQAELAKTGIAKSRKNKQGEGYMFRGIDDVYAALAPLLAEHRLCVIPRMMQRDIAERTSSKGNPLFYVTVHAEFDFVSAEDGSKHTAATFGEAMDSGDKATNKAMSAAYKYAAFMTFAIPTEGDNDADASTPEPAVTKPDGFDTFVSDLKKMAEKGTAALKTEWAESSKELRAHMTASDPKTWEAIKQRAADVDAKVAKDAA